MKKRIIWRTRLGIFPLFLSLVILLGGVALSILGVRKAPLDYASVQLAASMRMDAALDSVRGYVLRHGLIMEPADINQTGLIGPVWTELTTSVGSEDVKRTALQPDWAALMVRLFMDAGIKPGDAVAAGFSGSFPGLCLAVICAANEMDLDIRIIASLGSSMYGATRPELHIVTIMEIAREAGVVAYEMPAVSLGGDFDQGRGVPFYPDARTTLLRLANDTGYHVIDQPTVSGSIKERLRLYGEDIKCFVNVGGASTNIGMEAEGISFPNGLVTTYGTIPASDERGLIFEYLAQDAAVINMLYINRLANEYGLPLDPSPMTKPGETNVYYMVKHPRWPAALALPLGLVPILAAHHRLRNPSKRNKDA